MLEEATRGLDTAAAAAAAAAVSALLYTDTISNTIN